jgi:hypothetical protein
MHDPVIRSKALVHALRWVMSRAYQAFPPQPQFFFIIGLILAHFFPLSFFEVFDRFAFDSIRSLHFAESPVLPRLSLKASLEL